MTGDCEWCGGEHTADTPNGPVTIDHTLCRGEYLASIPEEWEEAA